MSVKYQVLACLDEWWCHTLHLPGGTRICDAFDRTVLGEDDDLEDA